MTTVQKPTKFRWFLAAMAFFAMVTNYLDRANLSIALPYMNNDLHLSATQSGLILGAFFWTYSVCQIPAGVLVDRLGAKIMFTGAVVWWSFFTMITGLASGAASLLGFRLLLGVGEAAAFPAAAKFVERWFPKTERGMATGIYSSGARGGSLLALPVCTAIIMAWGWKASFIVTGVIGIVWAIIWIAVAKEFPSQSKLVNAAELKHIGDTTTAEKKTVARVRWSRLLKSRVIWAMSFGFAAQSYVIYFFITWYPTYLVAERGFSMLKLGFFGILPGIAGFCGSWVGGYLTDKIAKSSYGLNFARKFCIVVGLALSSTIGLAGIVSEAWLAVLMLSVAFFGVSVATTNILALPADLSPSGSRSIAGTVAGFQNAISNLAGIASPAMIGYLKDTTGSFAPGLISASIVAIIGCLIYIFALGPIRPDVLEHLVEE